MQCPIDTKVAQNAYDICMYILHVCMYVYKSIQNIQNEVIAR